MQFAVKENISNTSESDLIQFILLTFRACFFYKLLIDASYIEKYFIYELKIQTDLNLIETGEFAGINYKAIASLLRKFEKGI